MTQKSSTTEQLNKLDEFRQLVYRRGLTRKRDARFELIEAMLLSRAVGAFPELSLSPVCRRGSPSAYTDIERGELDRSRLSCDHWTILVDIAYWRVFLARDLAQDRPLPWQKPQTDLTPGRVQ